MGSRVLLSFLRYYQHDPIRIANVILINPESDINNLTCLYPSLETYCGKYALLSCLFVVCRYLLLVFVRSHILKPLS